MGGRYPDLLNPIRTGIAGYSGGKGSELKKRDSFEGHELAVECLVNAVQECRKAGSKIRKKDDNYVVAADN